MSIGVFVVREQLSSATTLVVRGHDNARKSPTAYSSGCYRKPYWQPCNLKLTSFEQAVFGQQWTTDTASNRQANASKKKLKHRYHTKKIKFYANAHCTHLPLPSNAQANPKAKSKECNHQRFI